LWPGYWGYGQALGRSKSRHIWPNGVAIVKMLIRHQIPPERLRNRNRFIMLIGEQEQFIHAGRVWDMGGKKPKHGHDRDHHDDENEGQVVKRIPKPSIEEVLEHGEEVMSHEFGGAIHSEIYKIYKYNGYYVFCGADTSGPFKTLSAAANVEGDSIFTLTSASTEITCTELTAKQLAKRLNCENIEEYEDYNMDEDDEDDEEDDDEIGDNSDSSAFEIVLNGEIWVLLDGLFHKTGENSAEESDEVDDTEELPD
jgi:hypothetical protein